MISLNSVSIMRICVVKVILKGTGVIYLHSFNSEKNWCRYQKILLNDCECMKISPLEVMLLLYEYGRRGNMFF